MPCRTLAAIALAVERLGVNDDEVIARSDRYLDAWKKRNFGEMAGLVSPLIAEPTVSKTAGMVRDAFAGEALTDFALREVVYAAPAVAIVRVTFVIDGVSQQGAMRWIRGDQGGMAVAPNEDGEWGLMSWTRPGMANERRRLDG